MKNIRLFKAPDEWNADKDKWLADRLQMVAGEIREGQWPRLDAAVLVCRQEDGELTLCTWGESTVTREAIADLMKKALAHYAEIVDEL